MYNIAKDSLFQPRNLLKYRNKSGFFTFLYLLVLSLFLSIGAIVYYAGYDANSTITSDTTGCALFEGDLVCDGAVHDSLTRWNLYDYSIYFLNPEDDLALIASSLTGEVMVFQDDELTFFLGGTAISSFALVPDDQSVSFDGFIASLKTTMLVTILMVNFLGNLILLVFISLISTLPFLRLRKFIQYKKLYKLVVFSITPLAILLTFYYLIDLPQILFFLLMFLGYRTVFIVQRELTYQTIAHLENLSDNVVEGEYKEVVDEDSENKDGPEDGESPDDES